MPESLPRTTQDFAEIATDDEFYEYKVSPALIAAFREKAVKVSCPNTQVLFNAGEQGDCVYLLLTGEVVLLLPLTSMDSMGFRAQSGSFVGLPAAFSNEPYSMTAVALKGAELGVMSRDKFCELIATDAKLSFDVLRILAAETRAARRAIVDFDGGLNPNQS